MQSPRPSQHVPVRSPGDLCGKTSTRDVTGTKAPEQRPMAVSGARREGPRAVAGVPGLHLLSSLGPPTPTSYLGARL